jgi:hypothetical protein
MLMVHDPDRNTGVSEARMKRDCPATYKYLLLQKEVKLTDKVYLKFFDKERDPFWTMFGCGPYTMQPWKVVWKEQAASVVAAVISTDCRQLGEAKLVIPNHKCVFVGLGSEEEAHYLCGMLNSSLLRFLVGASTVSTQQSGHILQTFRIPSYGPTDHQLSLAKAAAKCHALAASHAAPANLDDMERVADEIAGAIWGLPRKQAEAVRRVLREERDNSAEDEGD